jgi:hypothetical protein
LLVLEKIKVTKNECKMSFCNRIYFFSMKEPTMQAVGSQPTAPKSGKIAFQQGLFFGLVLAGINDALFILNSVFNQTPTVTGANSGAVGTAFVISFAVGCLIFLLDLGAFLGAGILASRQTARLSTGVFAGMWAAGIYGFIDFIVKVVIQFTVTIPATTQSLQGSRSTGAQSAADVLGLLGLVGAFLLVLAAVGLGAGLGVLGGLIGRNISKVKLPERMLVAYPGVPYGMYPMYSMPGAPVQPPYPVPMQFMPAFPPISMNDGYAVPVPGAGQTPSVVHAVSTPLVSPYPQQAAESAFNNAVRAEEPHASVPGEVSVAEMASSGQHGRIEQEPHIVENVQSFQGHSSDDDRTQRLHLH